MRKLISAKLISEGYDLSGANLTKADLRGCNFSAVDLRTTDLVWIDR